MANGLLLLMKRTTSLSAGKMDQFPTKLKKKDLAATWSILDREPGMDDLAEGADEILKKMGEDLKVYPFQDKDRQDRLFLARFEFAKYGESSQFPEAVKGESVAFIDFLTGFPIDCIEMLVAIGEFSSKAKEGEASKVSVQEGKGVTAPVPKSPAHFFKWPEKDKILLNLTAIVTKDVAKIFAPNLDGEPKPAKVHWWFRVQLFGGTKKFPVPGEFLGLGVRMMPDMYWGHQKSSPFLYSGNWMDTVYYTGARITEVIPPTDLVAYPTYKVKWRKDEVVVNPSDFAEYKVDDRVTILKDVATEKKTQLWKDDDMKFFGGKEDMAPADITWMIAPITFYGLETPAGG
jgi:hypothetical protein